MLDHLATGTVADTGGGEPQAGAARAEARMSAWVFVAAALAIFCLGLALRFWDLARAPVWMDEAFTYVTAQLPLKTIVFGQIDNHPPLFYAVQHLWQAVDPRLTAVRAPAVVAGGLAVLAVTLAGADLISRPAGLLAGLFLALSTSHNYFSQDARMYPLLSLGLALAAWGGAGLAQRPRLRLRYGALYVLGGMVAVYTQVVALLFLASLNLALLGALALVRAPRRNVLDLVIANSVLGLLSVPWLVSLATALGGFRGLRVYPASLAIWFLGADIGFPAAAGGLRKAGLLLIVAVCVFGAWAAWRRRAPAAAAGLAALVLYPLLLVAANLATPILEHRVFTPCALGAALLFGAGLAAVSRPLRYAGMAGFVALAIVFLVEEHRARVKPEDVPQALALADQAGFAGAPILTCDFFPALTAYEIAPERRVFFLTPSDDLPPGGEREAVRLDGRFGRALPITMAKLHPARAAQFAPYLGDAADARANAAELYASGRIVVINAVCGSRWTDPYLRRLGFVKAAAPRLKQPTTVVFSNIWTELALWRRAAPGAP